jgi:hypothetical protein
MKSFLIVVITLVLVALTLGCRTTPEPNPYAEVKVKDIIQFGNYSWRVLDVQDDRALVITEEVIEQRTYNTEEKSGTTWETCSLRTYLNGDFYNRFSAKEQELIIETTLENLDNTWDDTRGGNATTDKIFLLSIDDAKKYFENDDDRRAVYSEHSSNWWLRSPGGLSYYASLVHFGYVSSRGWLINSEDGVRPALWLKIKTVSEIQTTAEPKQAIINEINVGETRNLQFGAYTWRVLAVENDRALLITENTLPHRQFNEIEEVVTWETCTLRAYLNSEFYDKFSAEERSLILYAINEYPFNPSYNKRGGGNDTLDKIFILSIDEAGKYFDSDDDRRAMGNGIYDWWWLRSPGRYTWYAAYVNDRGWIYHSGFECTYGPIGFRPALWLNLG